MTKKIAVLGSGSWATALAKILLHNVDVLHWWIREPDIIDNLKTRHHNHKYLSSVEFDIHRLHISNNIHEIIAQADILLFCIPAAFLPSALAHVTSEEFQGKTILSAIKGIVPTHQQIVSDYFHEEYKIPYEQIGVISGPSHAEEVAEERLTYLTVASVNQEIATEVASYIRSFYIKTTLSEDIIGIEYATVLKNIMAVASGICLGIGYGDNFQAVLVSNAIREMQQFAAAVYPIERNIMNSVYLGDLLVTAYSKHSRNRVFGNMIGRGYSVKAAQLEMNMIAEGYFAVHGLYEINKRYKVDLPIVDAVYNILYEGISPIMEMKILTEKLS